MQLIFKTEKLIYRSKTNIDAIILFGKITYLFGSRIRKMLIRGFHGNENSTFVCGS